MKFLVITSAPSLLMNGCYHAYTPYVIEMDLWFSQVEEVVIMSPTRYSKKLLTAPFIRKDIKVISVPNITFNIESILKSVVFIPFILYKMYSLMRVADHIHLRCPGNMGLLGCMVQVFFPNKIKTAKYAGNWDPKAKQPWSYRLQKWILSNEFLTRNMKVLVYGEWPGQTKNITPFFTASYSESKIEKGALPSFAAPYRFLFVGTLTPGKNPLYAVQLVEALQPKGISCELNIYGEGSTNEALRKYANEKGLAKMVKLHGNQNAEIVEAAYKDSHFLILPSRSEGWPKVVAEAMFWGVIPISTSISCVPWMLGHGERGLLLTMDLEKDTANLLKVIDKAESLQDMAIKAQAWSREYTLEKFESEIKKLL